MKSFAVYLNNKIICTVGGVSNGNIIVSAAIIGQKKESCFLGVNGFDSSIGYHLNWCFKQLEIGDEVRIILDDRNRVDEPINHKSVEDMDHWAVTLEKPPE